MKRIGSVLLLLIFALSLSVTAFAAESKTYQLGDLGMYLDIPADYVTFTRDLAENDPNLAAYGLTKEEMSAIMISNGTYLISGDQDISFQIFVMMKDSEVDDLNRLSDSKFSEYADSITAEYATADIAIDDYGVYQQDQAKFIKFTTRISDGSEIAYGLQYWTVYNHQLIMITLQSYSGEIDGNQETVMRAIVDSVRFGQAAAENGSVTAPAVQGDSSTPTEGDGSETTNSDSSEATEGDSSAPGESDSAAAADSDGLSQGSFGSMSNLFFGLLFTAAVYSLPIVIYRFAIAKHPVEKASAKRITIVYGIAAFVIMFGILFALNGSGAAGASIVFWSIVNYLVLTRGKATGTEPPAAEADEQREEQASAEAE